MACTRNVCNPSGVGVLKNHYSGKVIGVSGNCAVLQSINGNQHQQWQLIQVASIPCETRYYIKSIGTGYFLDVEGSGEGKPLIVFRHTGSLTQQWYVNPDGSLVNVGTSLAASTSKGSFEDGTPIIAYGNQGGAHQVFHYQY